MDYDLIWRKDARHAVLHNEGKAAVAAIEEIPAVEMQPQIYGYDLENLRLFAELCKEQGVTDKDLKNVASDAPTVDAASAWISVEDRLPEEYVNVLAFDGNEIVMAYYGKTGWTLVDLYECEDVNAKYWMPLPEPPRKE